MNAVKDPTAGLWGYVQAAEHVGVSAATLRSYRRSGRLPAPDLLLLDRPFWKPATIQQWHATRPGRGRWGRSSSASCQPPSPAVAWALTLPAADRIAVRNALIAADPRGVVEALPPVTDDGF